MELRPNMSGLVRLIADIVVADYRREINTNNSDAQPAGQMKSPPGLAGHAADEDDDDADFKSRRRKRTRRADAG